MNAATADATATTDIKWAFFKISLLEAVIVAEPWFIDPALNSVLGSCLQEQGQQDWVESEVNQQRRVCCPGH